MKLLAVVTPPSIDQQYSNKREKQINVANLHEEESLLTCKLNIPSIFNTFNKIVIARNVHENYVSNFYYDRHVEFYNQEFFSSSVLMNCNTIP